MSRRNQRRPRQTPAQPVVRPPIERVRMLVFIAVLPGLVGLAAAGVATGDKLYFYIAFLFLIAGLVMTWIIDLMRRRS